MHHRQVVLAAAAASLLCACAHQPGSESADVALGPAYAVETPPTSPPREITQFADQNRDGKVTRQEAKVDPLLARNFDHYDLDHNDVLDRGEFARLENGGRPGIATGAEGFTIETPAAMPYDEAAQESAPASNSSLNRTGTDQIRPQ